MDKKKLLIYGGGGAAVLVAFLWWRSSSAANNAAQAATDAASSGPGMLYMPSSAGAGAGGAYTGSGDGLTYPSLTGTDTGNSSPLSMLAGLIAQSQQAHNDAGILAGLNLGAYQTASVTHDANGNATVHVGPDTGAITQDVTGLYQSILGRTPDQAGLAFYTSGVSQGSMTMGDVSRYMSNSPEYQASHDPTAGAISQLYQSELGRTADAAGLNFYEQGVASGKMTVAQVKTYLDNSGEYKATHPPATGTTAGSSA